MNSFSRTYPHSQILYAQNCPEEPLIFGFSDAEPPVCTKRKLRKRQTRRVFHYKPRIINHSHSKEEYVAIEHARQLASLKKRIRECKSIAQRKKDHNDPILYPSYFVRDSSKFKDVRVDGFLRKLVEPKQKKSKIKLKSKFNDATKSNSKIGEKELVSEVMIPLPAITYRQQSHLDSQQGFGITRELPNCDPSSVWQYMLKKGIYSDSDMGILRFRMIHYYGQNRVNIIWRQLNLKGMEDKL